MAHIHLINVSIQRFIMMVMYCTKNYIIMMQIEFAELTGDQSEIRKQK